MPSLKVTGKFRGWNKDSPIYKTGFVVGAQSLKSSSSSEKESSEAPQDPMLPAMDGSEEWFKAQAAKYSSTHPVKKG
jgi:hypothetical protein